MIELKRALGVEDDVAAEKLVGRVSSFPEKAMALEEIVLAVLDFCALQTFAQCPFLPHDPQVDSLAGQDHRL